MIGQICVDHCTVNVAMTYDMVQHFLCWLQDNIYDNCWGNSPSRGLYYTRSHQAELHTGLVPKSLKRPSAAWFVMNDERVRTFVWSFSLMPVAVWHLDCLLQFSELTTCECLLPTLWPLMLLHWNTLVPYAKESLSRQHQSPLYQFGLTACFIMSPKKAIVSRAKHTALQNTLSKVSAKVSSSECRLQT